MKKNRTLAGLVLAALAVSATMAHAQPGHEPVAAAARCDKEVRDYLQTIRYIREAAGTQIGDRVAAGYVPEDAVRKVQGEQGSCAAAQLIREKSARRS